MLDEPAADGRVGAAGGLRTARPQRQGRGPSTRLSRRKRDHAGGNWGAWMEKHTVPVDAIALNFHDAAVMA